LFEESSRLPLGAMMKPAVVLGSFLLAPMLALGTFLRNREEQPSSGQPPPPTAQETQAKWDQQDQMAHNLFAMGCGWKHSKDVDNAVTEQVANKKIRDDETFAAKQKIQQANLDYMADQCAKLGISQTHGCRADCVVRHTASVDKIACDNKCNLIGASFSDECKNKVDVLKTAYGRLIQQQQSMQICYNTHCKSIPTTWPLTTIDAITNEVTNHCATVCAQSTDGNCTATCSGSCNGQGMLDCTQPLRSAEDPIGPFCEEVWTMMHSSSMFDGKTGDPVPPK